MSNLAIHVGERWGKRVRLMHGAALRMAAVIFVLLASFGSIATTVSAQAGDPAAAASPIAPVPDGDAPADQQTPGDVTSQAATIQIEIDFSVCMNDDRIDETDYFFASGFRDAATSDLCTTVGAAYDPDWTEVHVVLDGPEQYVAHFSNMTYAYIDIVPGTYEVSVQSTTGHAISSTMDGTFTVASANESQNLTIVHYRASQDQTPVGTVYLYGFVADCIDADRAGEMDALVEGTIITSDVQADCVHAFGAGQTSLILSGTPADGGTFDPITISVNEAGYFDVDDPEIPAGTYTLTDTQTGNTTNSFVLSSYDACCVNSYKISVFRYVAELLPIQPIIDIAPIVCESSTRAGETDLILKEVSAAGETCFTQLPTEPVNLTLTNQDDDSTHHLTLQPGDAHEGGSFSNIPPGTYVLTDDASGAKSEPLTTVAGMEYAFVVIHYVPVGSNPGAPTGEGTAYIYGDLYYCTSDTRSGDVDFIIRKENFSSSSIADCSADSQSLGQVVLQEFSDAAGTNLVQTWSTGNSSGFGFPDAETPAWYRLGFKPTAFSDDVTWSEIFGASSEDNFYASIYVYTAPPAAAPLTAQKEYCYQPDRAGETIFSLESNFTVEATDTLPCRAPVEDDGPITFTLTNQETGDSLSFDVDESGYVDFGALPEGTYVVSEAAAGYAKTSAPFTIDSDTDWNLLHVRNMTDEPIDEQEAESSNVSVQALHCVDDTRVGEFDFSYTQYMYNAADEPVLPCRNAVLGDFSFELLDATPGDVAGSATYPLIGADHGYFYLDQNLTPGTYLLRETTTGATSDPFAIWGDQVYVTFYAFQAAATPTPSATATPSVTATATIPDPGKPIPPPRATSTPGTTAGGDGTGGGSGSGSGGSVVTTLPSTGQGSGDASESGMALLLGLAMSLLLGAALLTRQSRQR